MELTTLVQVLNKVICISLCINTLGKDMTPTILLLTRGSPHVIVAKVLDCNIVINEFKLQFCYYAQFWTNILGKVMNSLIFSSSR